MFRFFRLLKKKQKCPNLSPSVMSFGEFYNAFDASWGRRVRSGRNGGIVACQAVPSLEIWILENWSKGDVPVPPEVQRLYDEAVGDLYQRPEPIELSNKGREHRRTRSIERGSRFLLI